MRILNASHLSDTGGNGIRTVRAFAKLTDWHYRFTSRQQNWLEYPVDLPWEDALEEWRRADVVHVRDGFQAQEALGAPNRPTVIHHHGTQFRLKHAQLLPEQRRRRAIGLASTLDLYLMAPDDLTWAPALYDLDWLRGMRRPVGDGVLRIAHAPTNRKGKSTAAFLAAAERLGRKLPVEVILIERRSWAECLAAKATADVYFDQVLLGYGNNAIEAWGMGIPVIAGADRRQAARHGYQIPDGVLDEMRRRFDMLPFYLADEGTIYEALRAMADPETRAAYARLGQVHAERFHSEEYGVQMLSRVYEAAAAGRSVAA